MASSQLFDMDSRDLKKLRRLFKRAPRQMRRVTAGVLNTFAFDMKNEEIPRTLDLLMTIRDERFVKSKLRFETAKGNMPISVQSSIVGSIIGPRFSGWEEQENGTRTARTNVPTLDARGGNFSKRMQGQSRLKPNQVFKDPEEITKAKDDDHRLFIFLKIHERKRKQQAFRIRRPMGKFKPGLYRFKRNKIKKQQSFHARDVQPNRVPWMKRSIENYFNRVSIPRIFQKEMRRVFKLY